ncbi:MAG TPA: bifunctional precorrin-2 dehydrogenase/sirohydrochlorin ferrochelatase [Blastocatellia bacterium]|nr:bifunctional precorrin-2 dehydrogenase/sirohydrochlorin ferrochelatase [Blastocatellia bacterium]HMV87377.1 bifunctional precorrin-2 dehydrogenase/sirohydrochlorin ferrochelatase [Blastocatellia bacterium]HMX24931.1 bifunctional precorrin-2 dehydrogenase/sirohydrochlorin ferrochelatase [Blastocatellia bacterium]HMY75487.1 bifunctional precorrin-2 dehydrogenase/sirohydrochlorin ferrochelatase [Blastocatellia bacterium]HMZ17966.1 bifunctional precorrin-2 dehydrogenase/sirohydrochlorin ferroche
MRYYPIYLDLKDRAVLVVGGGLIAEGKAMQLLDAGAKLRLVSPDLTPHLAQLAERGEIEYRQRKFEIEDLNGVALVISATNDPAANGEIARRAAELGLLFNVVDQTALCNFITPALVTRGDLQISVSSGGGSPSVVQRVKREIAGLIGEEYGELLAVAAEMRAEAKRLIPDFEARRKVLHAFAESEAIELLRAGKREEARQLAFELLQQAAGTSRFEGGER